MIQTSVASVGADSSSAAAPTASSAVDGDRGDEQQSGNVDGTAVRNEEGGRQPRVYLARLYPEPKQCLSHPTRVPVRLDDPRAVAARSVFLLRYRDKDSPRNFESIFPYEGIGILKDADPSAEGKRKRRALHPHVRARR